MNLFNDMRALVIETLTAMQADGSLPAGLDFTTVAVEPPRDPAHGDMATNAAMVLAKPSGLAPRIIAEALALRPACIFSRRLEKLNPLPVGERIRRLGSAAT